MTTTMTDNRQILIRKVHMSFWLRWAKLDRKNSLCQCDVKISLMSTWDKYLKEGNMLTLSSRSSQKFEQKQILKRHVYVVSGQE